MLKEYLLDHLDELEQLATSINAWNGELEHLMVLENDEEFFNTWYNNKPMEAVKASYYGEYKYNDAYVRFDGYGNLESFNESEYAELLMLYVDDVINELQNVKDECNWIESKLIEMLEKEEAC